MACRVHWNVWQSIEGHGKPCPYKIVKSRAVGMGDWVVISGLAYLEQPQLAFAVSGAVPCFVWRVQYRHHH
jgi:hypothetical protein